jgi:diphosphomevalonate decarboxylase
VEIFHQVREWRGKGLPLAYTVDAGANVHVICLTEYAKEVAKHLRELPGVSDVLVAGAGAAAQIV